MKELKMKEVEVVSGGIKDPIYSLEFSSSGSGSTYEVKGEFGWQSGNWSGSVGAGYGSSGGSYNASIKYTF